MFCCDFDSIFHDVHGFLGCFGQGFSPFTLALGPLLVSSVPEAQDTVLPGTPQDHIQVTFGEEKR